MSKVNADLYLVFAADDPWTVHYLIGVFDTLDAAKEFYESAMIEVDWEHRFFDTLEEVTAHHQKVGDGQYEQRPCGDYWHKVCSERRTPLQIFDEEMHIATVKNGQLVACSYYRLLDKDTMTYGWKDI